jgi:hypothetical protein
LQLPITKYRILEESIGEATLEQLIAIADYYQVSVDALLGRASLESDADLLHFVRNQPTVYGRKLTAHEQTQIEEFIWSTTEQTQKLLQFAELIRDDSTFFRKLQELKIVNAKVDNGQILETIDKLLE